MFATKKQKKSRGSALIAVMMFAASVSALCLFTLTSSTSTYATARTRLESTKAFYVAEGGVDMLMGNISADHWWPARNTATFPTAGTDGKFESGWLALGAKGGEFKIEVWYQVKNSVPSTFTGTGFPSGFVPFTNLVLTARATDAPAFDRVFTRVIGRYNGTTRWVQTGIEFKNTLYGAAIVSDAAPVTGGGSGKGLAKNQDAVVMDTLNNYVYGGITSNNGVYSASSTAPLTTSNAPTLLAGFSGEVNADLYGTAGEIPDFTQPGAATQLFDFNRFKAAAAAGAGSVYANLDAFCAAMRAANAAGTKLQGIIYVTVDAAVEGGSPKIDTSTSGTGVGAPGINVEGTLIFHFANTGDRFYKMFGTAPLNINAGANDGTFSMTDPATFKTGYPPALPSGKQAWNVDITGAGFKNFAPNDDLPALMFDSGTVDIHYPANICGVMYSPSFMEIENKTNGLQYFNGSIISGGGIYFEGGSGTGAGQIVNFDEATVDRLATFDLRGQSPSIVSYAVGQ